MTCVEIAGQAKDVFHGASLSEKTAIIIAKVEDMPDLFAELQKAVELQKDGVRGRYAPSPTGSLHLGNLRTALLAWLQVRLQDGVLVLRMEDLDLPRVKEGSAEEIMEDLRWLGLDWDEGPDRGGPVGPYDQSARDEIYLAALDFLHESGLTFQCYCSRKDVIEASSAPHGPGVLIYPGTCRLLTPQEAQEARSRHPGRLPSSRFLVAESEICFRDQIAGEVREVLTDTVGDFVIRRSDNLFAYQLAVVVDDALMGITDVLRGEDLLSSTARQIALFEALNAPLPRFWHVPLMKNEVGERLSKRDGSDSLQSLREKGFAASDVIGLLAHSLGWVPPDSSLSAAELLEELTVDDLRLLKTSLEVS